MQADLRISVCEAVESSEEMGSFVVTVMVEIGKQQRDIQH